MSQRRIHFTTRDLPMMAALAVLGGMVSTYVNAVGDFFQSLLGFAGTTPWAATAQDAWWRENGQIEIRSEPFPVSRGEVEPPALLGQVQANITDVAPSVAAALGPPAQAQAAAQALAVPQASHVQLLFLDGFGCVRYIEALDAGLVPNLAALPEPLIGLTDYPPSTRVGTAALLTGMPPPVNGVNGRSVCSTDIETLSDVAAAAGLDVVAVEGEAMASKLRGAEVQPRYVCSDSHGGRVAESQASRVRERRSICTGMALS